MYYAIEALTYLFDMVIIIIYMNGIFHKEIVVPLIRSILHASLSWRFLSM